MTVEDVQRVAEQLVVDTSQTIVATRSLYSLANQLEVKRKTFRRSQSRSVKWFTDSSSQSNSE
jgi:hypothetical protein